MISGLVTTAHQSPMFQRGVHTSPSGNVITNTGVADTDEEEEEDDEEEDDEEEEEEEDEDDDLDDDI